MHESCVYSNACCHRFKWCNLQKDYTRVRKSSALGNRKVESTVWWFQNKKKNNIAHTRHRDPLCFPYGKLYYIFSLPTPILLATRYVAKLRLMRFCAWRRLRKISCQPLGCRCYQRSGCLCADLSNFFFLFKAFSTSFHKCNLRSLSDFPFICWFLFLLHLLHALIRAVVCGLPFIDLCLAPRVSK